MWAKHDAHFYLVTIILVLAILYGYPLFDAIVTPAAAAVPVLPPWQRRRWRACDPGLPFSVCAVADATVDDDRGGSSRSPPPLCRRSWSVQEAVGSPDWPILFRFPEVDVPPPSYIFFEKWLLRRSLACCSPCTVNSLNWFKLASIDVTARLGQIKK